MYHKYNPLLLGLFIIKCCFLFFLHKYCETNKKHGRSNKLYMFLTTNWLLCFQYCQHINESKSVIIKLQYSVQWAPFAEAWSSNPKYSEKKPAPVPLSSINLTYNDLQLNLGFYSARKVTNHLSPLKALYFLQLCFNFLQFHYKMWQTKWLLLSDNIFLLNTTSLTIKHHDSTSAHTGGCIPWLWCDRSTNILHIGKMLSLPQPWSCFNSSFSALPTGQKAWCIPKRVECGGRGGYREFCAYARN